AVDQVRRAHAQQRLLLAVDRPAHRAPRHSLSLSEGHAQSRPAQHRTPEGHAVRGHEILDPAQDDLAGRLDIPNLFPQDLGRHGGDHGATVGSTLAATALAGAASRPFPLLLTGLAGTPGLTCGGARFLRRLGPSRLLRRILLGCRLARRRLDLARPLSTSSAPPPVAAGTCRHGVSLPRRAIILDIRRPSRSSCLQLHRAPSVTPMRTRRRMAARSSSIVATSSWYRSR